MPGLRIAIPILLFLFLSYACGPNLPDEVVVVYDELPTEIDFNIHVRPILSDRCFACHGPDAATQEAGLRLDKLAGATQELKESPGKYAIVPGKLEKSEVFHRIFSDDENVIMPPPESNLILTAYEKAVLTKWIEQGAEYKKHWAFIPPEMPQTPKVATTEWVKNPIDNFVAARLEREGLTPSPEADKELLLRRLTLDLTGLPPTGKELENFLADESPGAYEKVVDRLLQSPHYGEHLAVDWLDLARYADTHGYTVDRFRDMSPWRDWVIDAYNENMPFDSFVVWQLAGDLLPNPSREQILATGFNRNHQQNMEGGIIPEEFRVEYVADRVNTFGTAFIGLTMGCARCHDHKYDPISAKEYYQTFSFFNNVEEAGQISYDDAMPVPTLLLPDVEVEKITAHLKEQIAQKTKQLADLPTEGFANWWETTAVPTKTQIPNGLTAAYDLNNSLREKSGRYPMAEMRRSASSDEKPTFAEGYNGKGIQFDGDAWLHCKEAGVFSRAEPFTVSVWVNVPEELENGVLFHKGNGAMIFNFKGYHLAIEDNRLELLMAHVAPYNAILKYATTPLPRDEWVHLIYTYDGSSKASGLKLYINGTLAEMETQTDRLYKDILFGGSEESPLQFGARWRGKGATGARVDEIKVFDRELTALEAAHLAGKDDLQLAIATRGKDVAASIRAATLKYYAANYVTEYRRQKEELKALYAKENATIEPVQEVMVMQEMKERRPAYILERGLYDAYGEEVFPGTVEAVLPMNDELPKNRLGLAQWLLEPEHPLFARVTVNRFWQHYFGTGIVKTAEDFGSQGDRPTHPELLDYLAITFRESGWDVKALQKQIVMSATYRQSSTTTPDLREKDGDNQLLARGPSSRLSAEMLRDNALAAADLLVDRVKGGSVNPYQPEGLWKVNGGKYEQHHGDSLYRRSLYTIWKRSVPNPTQSTFDAPTRSECTVRRQKTSTPLQALILLNDPTFVEASRVIGEEISRTETPEIGIGKAFQRLTGRRARPEEMRLLVELRDREYEKFYGNAQRINGWLETGEAGVDDQLDPVMVAANSIVATTIINMDATTVKR